MFKKILKWTGIVLLVLIMGVALTVTFRQHLKFDAPLPNIKASTDSAVIAHGKHLVLGAAHCVDCHSKYNADSLIKLGQEVPLSGGYNFDLPFGEFYTRNITPDKETGIGNKSDAEIARVLRYSVHSNGEAVYGFMPFQNMSDEDLTAIISYLRSATPVHNKVPDHKLNILGNIIKAFMVKPVGPTGDIPKSVPKDTTVEYGRYMAMVVANCNECHTKRDNIGGFVGEPLAGGSPFEEKGKTTLTPPNLTPDPTGRIYNWSEQDFIRRFRMGKLIPHSHMPWASFGRMDDVELKAIYKFLKSLKPVKTVIEKQQ